MPDTITRRLTITDPVPGVRCSLQKDDAPFVPARRFVYICIGTSAGDHISPWSRRAKIDIHGIPREMLIPGAVLEAVLPGREKDGSPACATVRPTTPWRPV
jgi:hypothetical protein